MNQNRRVVVTGLGCVSSLGLNVPTFWQQLKCGRSGIAPIELVDRSQLRFTNGAEVRDFEPEAHFDRRQLLMLDRFAQFGVMAAREAIEDAAIDWSDSTRSGTGVITGSSVGGLKSQDETFVSLYKNNATKLNPFTVPRVMASAAASHICMEFGLSGPSFAVSSACSSSNHAIGQAFWMVRSGLIDAAVTGGSEAPLSYGNLKAWEAMRVIAPDTCRPFSRDRTGMILGEGGAMLVLESFDSAVKRSARIYGEIVGFGMSSDAHHLTQPLPEGAARAISMALRDGGLRPQDVGYINAHGTATRVNDAMETKAIRLVFGEYADKIPTSSTKSMHGHALAASGAIESVATLLALHNGILPPTINYSEPDPECDLDVIPNTARPEYVEFALSNSFAFGGLNAVLAFRRWLG